MSVGFDSSVESHTGTAGSVSEASYDFTLTVVGTVRGLLVLTFSQGPTASEPVNNSVKIDPTGSNMDVPAVSGGAAADTVTEPGTCKAWFLGSGIPGGNLALRVNRTNNTNVSYAVAVGVTANGDTEVYLPGIQLVNGDAAASPEKNVDDGSPGTNSLRFAGIQYGGSAAPTTGANSTALSSIVYSNDPNSTAAAAVRETNAGQGSRPVGWSAGASDDNASVYLAIREVAVSFAADPRRRRAVIRV